MTDAALNLLVIEDNSADFLLLKRHLRKQGLKATCTCVASTPELEAALDGCSSEACCAVAMMISHSMILHPSDP